MSYSCAPCDKIFNGINPYTDHINSANHKMKISLQMPNNLDSYMKQNGNTYKCLLCNIVLNSLQQAENHVAGKNHKKLLNNTSKNTATVISVPEIELKMAMKNLDPYIKQYADTYKCLLCNMVLNSLQQAQNHAAGKNHKKLLQNNSSKHIDIVTSVPSDCQSEELLHTFTFHDIKIENVAYDIKVFDINDPVSF